MSEFSIKWWPSVRGPCCYSHRSLNKLLLHVSFPPGVEQATSDSQSGAGLWRVELNDGQTQWGQHCRAGGGGGGHNVFTRVLLNIYCISIAIMLMWKNTQAPLWIYSDDELHDLHWACEDWAERFIYCVTKCLNGWGIISARKLWCLSNSQSPWIIETCFA